MKIRRSPDKELYEKSDISIEALLKAVHSTDPVMGFTHNFYRYPARFSPEFCRAAIETFTEPEEAVLDPFMGGGTAAVEALMAGRKFIGCDLNPLAVYLARVKTTPLTRSDIEAIESWGMSLQKNINLHEPIRRRDEWVNYQRNLPWWLRKTMEMAVETFSSLTAPRQRQFARCTLLKAGQRALDCRFALPNTEEFLAIHRKFVKEMLDGVREFSMKLRDAFETPKSLVWRHRRLLYRSARDIDKDKRIPQDWLPPRLVLTSPPYVGMHVLYHRWQIQGRRETPAPYWLANCEDSLGAAHYTFGDRKRKNMKYYLNQLCNCFSSITSLLDEKSIIIQLVGFSKPEQQLPQYLEALASIGLVEVGMGFSRRIWRIVPNRKWYTQVRDGLASTKEVLLIHRKAGGGKSL